ncbi:MAG: DUF4185 domain-containing protein [Bacilli bacterium]|nr:DUF4185 domain-containing protein [Bacilli bacterium]
MAKKLLSVILFGLLVMLLGCNDETTTTKTILTTITVEPCEWEFTETVNERIPIVALSADKSTISGNIDNFINMCKATDEHSLVFESSLIRSHQFIVELDAIYPLNRIEWINASQADLADIETVSIDFSLNGQSYTRVLESHALDPALNQIDLENQSARFIRFTFPYVEGNRYAIQDLRFILGTGLIVEEADEWTEAFKRYETWTGADGIFSFNLSGDDTMNATDPQTAFIFSDTFTGNVNPETDLRMSSHMINNSLGYYDGSTPISQGMRFAYGENDEGIATSAFPATAYLGFKPTNLYDSDGLSVYLDPAGLLTNEASGIMWKSEILADNWILLDLYDSTTIKDLYLWNFNGNPDIGTKDIKVLISDDSVNWTDKGLFTIPKASGDADEPYSLKIGLNDTVRYVKLELLSGYDASTIGLGKVLLTNSESLPLFASVTASGYDEMLSTNELTGRLWLQDGIVLDGWFYDFPILVKDFSTYFKVHRVGLIKAPIESGQIDFQAATYLSTPLQTTTPDGGIIYYGAGVMDNSDIDGYIYIYGYKDLAGRHLVAARVEPENFENFNAWRYYDGENWVKDINASAGLIDGVSAELSVSYIDHGMFAGKYMLVAMENTTSGRVVYASASSPVGEFSDYTLLYDTPEHELYNGAFTYNAKLHLHLSSPGEYLISYNVNTTKFTALPNMNIYRPRFLWVREVKTNP